MSDRGHIPVLAEQVLTLLNPRPGLVCLDCTIGRGGHAALIIPQLAPDGRYLAIDCDPANVMFAKHRLRETPVKLDILHANFTDGLGMLRELGIGQVDLLLADLGCASTQLDNPLRGLSFNAEGPLDMRMDPTKSRTAADFVNQLPQDDLANLIWRYGEERLSRKIARKIVAYRHRMPIHTTTQLAQIVREAIGRRPRAGGSGRYRFRQIDPATRTFMALRIAVNAELEALDRLLANLPQLIRPGGIAVVISFHSLEDRRVKHAFAALRREALAKVLTPKPIVPDDYERRANPRSRSAKLRAVRLN